MSTTIIELENKDIVVKMSGRGPMGPRGRQGEPGPAGPSEWGVIQGNISDQTDLQNALDAKADVGASYTKSEEDALLAQKADADSVYTKTETDSLLADKADSDTVYTKTETDTLLDAKADVGDSYTKAEEDALLAVKANSADVYTKTETDTLLADKADADDVYTKDEVDDALDLKADSADVYTKTETDSLLQDKAPVILNSASGSIASFSDGSPAPVTALSVAIDPVQDLHGYANPWPAGGGANKFDKDNVVSGYRIGTTGQNYADDTCYISAFIPVTVGTSYTKSGTTDVFHRFATYSSANISSFIRKIDDSNTITIESGESYIRFCGFITELSTASLAIGTTALNPWTPYSNICPISGRTSATVTREADWHLASSYTGDGYVSSSRLENTGDIVSTDSNNAVSGYFPMSANTPYKVIIEASLNAPSICFYDSNKTFISGVKYTYRKSFTGTTPNGTAYARMSYLTTSPYKNIIGIWGNVQTVTIDLDDTIYGAMYDALTGTMTVTHGFAEFDGSNDESWSKQNATPSKFFQCSNIFPYTDWQRSVYGQDQIGEVKGNQGIIPYTALDNQTDFGVALAYAVRCNFTDCNSSTGATVDNLRTYLASHPIQVWIPLKTPQTVQLTPSQLSTLLGQNNIWADTGDVAVTYRADTKLYIDGVASATAKVTRQMIADSATADGKAPKSLATGDLIIVGDELRKATANIGNGSAITASNSTIATLADVIKALQ